MFSLLSICTLLVVAAQFGEAQYLPTCSGTGVYASSTPENFKYKLIGNYGNGHAQHRVEITLSKPVTTWHALVCFENGLTCLTEVWNAVMDPIFRLGCFYVQSEKPVSLTSGQMISFNFNTFTASKLISVVPALIEFHGNGLVPVTEVNSLALPPQLYCQVCDGGYVASPSSCNVFHQCSNKTPYKFTCPANLHFNPWLNVCDQPANSGCNKPVQRYRHCSPTFNCPVDHFAESVEVSGCPTTK